MSRKPANPAESTSARRDEGMSPDTTTRAAILGAARELFESAGYNRTTVEQIRVLAGVSRASFYFYFADKKAVFLEVLDELSSDIEFLRETFAGPGNDEFARIVLDLVGFFAMWARYTNTFRDGFAITISDPDAQQLMRGMRMRRYSMLNERHVDGLTESTSTFPAPLRHLAPMLVLSLATNFVVRFFAEPDVFNRSNTEFEDAVLAVSEAWYRIIFGCAAPCTVSREVITKHRSTVDAILDEKEAARLATLRPSHGRNRRGRA
ncbi:MAG: TetR/AcrR family transcriptional regulator [Dehalococcoidia bacterium]